MFNYTHTSVIPEGKKTLKRAGNSKVKLSTAFYAAWQTPLVEHLHRTKHPFVRLKGRPALSQEEHIHATYKICGVKSVFVCLRLCVSVRRACQEIRNLAIFYFLAI